MTFEQFVKDNHKDFYNKIINDYKAAVKAEKDAEIAKKEAEKADVRAKTKFYENDFEYEVEFSYKGFSDGERTEELEFYEAFSAFTEDELGTSYEIVDDDTLGFEDNKTFEEILDEAGVTEENFTKEFEKFLFESDYRTNAGAAEDRWDYEARVVSTVEWTGKYYWQGHMDEIMAQMKQLRFKEIDD